MFDALGDKLEQVFKRLRGHGKITERHMTEALREVRMALLEADVALPVVTKFTDNIREQALGQDVLQSLTPEQHLLKFIHLELIRTMGEQAAVLDLGVPPPVTIMLVGLQGSGKTTSAAKLARYLKSERGRRPYLVPADVYRPAAIEQLTTLGAQLGLPVHPSTTDAKPVDLARAGVTAARTGGHDTVIIDTAGRLQIDEALMAEVVAIKAAVAPKYVFLVADAMTGQDAVNVADQFAETTQFDGVVMTKLDGDARGGAALSIKAVTGKPILYASTGEKLAEFEPFHPDRMASRILGMGDVLSFIEKAEKAVDEKQAEELDRKIRDKQFGLDDFLDQMKQLRRMGPISNMLGMLPGFGAMKQLKGVKVDERELDRLEAIVTSMTHAERRNPSIIDGSRRKRIARGSGTNVQAVNQLIKQFGQMQKMMRRMQQGKMPSPDQLIRGMR